MTDKKIKPEYLTPQTLHDWPLKKTEQALFNFDDFAATLARLVASQVFMRFVGD